jgi:hypothetical protein
MRKSGSIVKVGLFAFITLATMAALFAVLGPSTILVAMILLYGTAALLRIMRGYHNSFRERLDKLSLEGLQITHAQLWKVEDWRRRVESLLRDHVGAAEAASFRRVGEFQIQKELVDKYRSRLN